MIGPINAAVAKGVNRANVLRWIRDHQPIARHIIAGEIGLNPSTVTNIVRELIQDGIVYEAGTETSAAGRRPVSLAIDHEQFVSLGVEIGDTRVTVLACNLHGTILESTRINTVMSGSQPGNDIVSTALTAAHRLTDHLRNHNKQLIGVGIGMAGLINRTRREAVFSPNLGVQHQPIGELFEAELRLPVHVDNDVRAIARAEQWFGAGRGRKSLVCLHVGSGVGAGIVLDDQIYYGNTDSAGEIGHIVLDRQGPLCRCGHRGCLEVLAGGTALLREISEQLQRGTPSSLAPLFHSSTGLTFDAIGRAAEAGDELARDVLTQSAEYLGLGIANVVNSFDPELVVLCGPVIRSAGRLFGQVARTVAQESIYDCDERNITIVDSPLGEDAPALGASSIVLEHFFDNGGTV